MTRFTHFLLALLFFPFALTADPIGWQLDKDSDDIQIYTRPVINSNIREFKAITIVNTSVSSIISLLNDHENYPDWFHQNSNAFLLEQINPSEIVSYQDIDMPTLVTDRDVIVRTSMHTTKNNVIYRVIAAPNYCQQSDKLSCRAINTSGNILVKKLMGTYQLNTISTNKTKIIWQQHTELGGDLPSWMVNQSLINIPFQTLKNLKEKLTT